MNLALLLDTELSKTEFPSLCYPGVPSPGARRPIRDKKKVNKLISYCRE